MDLTSQPFENSLLVASTLLTVVIGLLVTLRRGHWLTTLVFSAAVLAIAAFQAGTLGILHAGTPVAARNWATYLARTSALASWLWLTLSVVLARSDPWHQLRNAAAYLALALAGGVVMSLVAGSPLVVQEVSGGGKTAFVVLGTLGKVYLMYLVVAMVAVLMNLERMIRNAQATAQKRLRPIFLALSFGILMSLLVVSSGLLYGGIKVSWMVANGAPVFVASVVTALALARRRLSDLTVPVARPVIYYSSVSLTLAGAFLLTMAVLSRLLPTLPPGARTTLSFVFYAVAGGGGLVLMLSPRSNRGIRRFIDRNFYANRYDYRREWERVSGAITPTARMEDIGHQIETLIRAVFDAERSAVYLCREQGGPFLRLHGPAGMPFEIAADNAVVLQLERTREPILFREAVLDLDQVPAAAENRETIRALSAAVCAPLMAGTLMVGLLWVSEKRSEEEFSSEDVDFLAAMARQLAASLWFARLAEQLAETRQLESLHRLSTFVLHDIKNHVSGLSLVVENARRHLSNPEFQRDAMAVVERTVHNLRELMSHVAGVARAPELQTEPCDVRDLLEEGVAACGLAAGHHDGITLELNCVVTTPVRLDRRLMLRVITNLLTNAREALAGEGSVSLEATEGAESGQARTLTLTVRDSGCGMSEEFVRTELFRPFATTKPSGLGVGLMQCRSIVEAHGGTIAVESHPGRGTAFSIRMPVEPPAPADDGPGGTPLADEVPDAAREVGA